MKTKQIVFTKPYTAELWEVECPPPERGEVTVEIDYSAISAGTEKANFIGQRNSVILSEDDAPIYPRVVGYSAAGRVVAIGEGISDLAVGDRVVAYWGTHQKLRNAKRNKLMKVPEGITQQEASLALIATFPMAAIRKTRIELGESALVMGLGILGIFAVEELHAAGAYPIIAADPIKERREMALRLGADYALDPTADDFAANVIALTGGGVHVCIEVTGLGTGLIQALDCMRFMGRVALLGCTRSSKFEIDYYGKVHGRGITLIGAHTMARPKVESAANLWTDEDDLAAVLNLTRGKRLPLAAVIGEIHSPNEAQEVFTRLANDKSFPVGVLFDWSLLQ